MPRKISTPPPDEEIVGYEDLTPDPENANQGTARGNAMLVQSMRDLGAGRSIVLDKNRRIIAGNKSARAAASLGLKFRLIRPADDEIIAVVRDDLDIEEARGRMLAYADNQVGAINLNFDAEQIVKDLDKGLPIDQFFNDAELQSFRDEVKVLGRTSASDGGSGDEFDDLPSALAGAAALKREMQFESNEPFNIPPLRADMLGELPKELKTWAGRDASDPDHEGWWLYCYGSDSVRGLDFRRTILAFYVDDYRFEPWWAEPDVYVGKMLNSGITMALSPNYSLWGDDAEAIHIYNTYRSRWLGRYMQEAGIMVIPDVNWSRPSSFDFCLAGIPKNAPCISVQIQNGSTEAEMRSQRYSLMKVIDELEPQHLLIYGGGDEKRRKMASVIPDGLGVTWIDSRTTVRSAIMKQGAFRP